MSIKFNWVRKYKNEPEEEAARITVPYTLTRDEMAWLLVAASDPGLEDTGLTRTETEKRIRAQLKHNPGMRFEYQVREECFDEDDEDEISPEQAHAWAMEQVAKL